MLKAQDAAIWEKLQEEVTLPVDKGEIPSDEVRNLVQLWHETFDGLLDDVIQRVKELVVDGLGLAREVELELILLVESVCHQCFAHSMAFRYKEESIDVKISTLVLLVLQYFKVDFLQRLFDSFKDQITRQGQYPLPQVLVSPQVNLGLFEFGEVGFEELHSWLNVKKDAYDLVALLLGDNRLIIGGFDRIIPLIDLQLNLFEIRVVSQICLYLVWDWSQHALLVQDRQARFLEIQSCLCDQAFVLVHSIYQRIIFLE